MFPGIAAVSCLQSRTVFRCFAADADSLHAGTPTTAE